MKHFLILGFFFFLLSCQKQTIKKVTLTKAGVTTSSIAFSKSCTEGSFQVYKKSMLGAAGYSQLSVGASVSVKGEIHNSPCHSGGTIRFTCEGSIAVDTNRAIVCTSGTVNGGTGGSLISSPIDRIVPNLLGGGPPSSNDSLGGLSASPTSPITPSGPVQLTSGQVHIFQNGVEAYVNLHFPHPSSGRAHLPQQICSAGFTCK